MSLTKEKLITPTRKMVLLGVLENLMLENTAKLKPQQIKVNSASYELETYM